MDKILIIGAGPTGLGAAWRLLELGHTNFRVIDAAPKPGGLASTYTDEFGFRWDVGVHALHSHYAYFDDVLKQCEVELWTHQRSAAAWMHKTWVPYPVQYNVGMLPRRVAYECVKDMWSAFPANPRHFCNFDEYLRGTFGASLYREFLKPYNLKVWVTPLSAMNTSWLGERVPPVDYDLVLKSAIMGSVKSDWGPNATFQYPMSGGIGGMWAKVAERIAPHTRTNCALSSLHFADSASYALTNDGESIAYDHLITTMPLDKLITDHLVSARCKDLDNARKLHRTSTYIVGLGMKGEIPKTWEDFSWTYFPEKQFPFYRAVPLSQYANDMAPDGYWSLMLEVAEEPGWNKHGYLDPPSMCQMALEEADLLAGQHIVSAFCKRLEYGYPVPTLDRDDAVSELLRYLESQRVYSRGRFGLWKYEVSNMDHSFMQGVEVADKILYGKDETIAKY